MSELIHYTNPQSRGMRTQALLDTFEIPHRVELLDFQKGETRTESYLKIHPYGRVPALVHGDVTVIESGAITLYLADLYAEKMGTPPPGTPGRARLYEWIMFFQSTLEPFAMDAFAGKDKSECRKKVRELLVAMESRVEGPYVLGENFTLLDVILTCELSWYKMVDIYPEGLQTYDSLMERVGPKIKMS